MREVRHANGLRTWRFGFDDEDVLAAMSTRQGGHSEGVYAGLNLAFHVGDDPVRVLENRRLLCGALGVSTFVIADQQHGAGVALITEAERGAGFGSRQDAERRLAATDALITRTRGLALGILVADCAPVVMVDRGRGVLAVVHVGRSGAVHDVIGATVRAMAVHFGTVAGDLEVGVGPCVGASGYELGEPQLTATFEAFGPELLAPTRPGHACFDLRAAVLRRLLDAGVEEARVEIASEETQVCAEDLFSDRRARPCGRFALVAALRA